MDGHEYGWGRAQHRDAFTIHCQSYGKVRKFDVDLCSISSRPQTNASRDTELLFSSFRDSFTIVPILVGSLSPEKESIYGRLFAPYLADPQSLFVVSSDFCHWGQRFRYTYYDRSGGPIYRSIQNLDRMVCSSQYLVKLECKMKKKI